MAAINTASNWTTQTYYTKGAGPVATFTVTASAPSAPSITGLTAATDSGTVGDKRTDDATPSISGTGSAIGDTITIFLDGSNTPLGFTTVDGSGNWTYVFTSALTVESHSVTATDTGSGSASPLSSPYTFNIDPVPITPGAPMLLSDTGSSNTDHITSNPAFSVGTPPGGETSIYSTNGTTYTTSAPTFATDGSADGQHTVYLEGQDAYGNVSAPSSLTFTLDTTPPIVSSITRVGSSPNNAGSDQFTVTFSEAVTGVDTSDFTVTNQSGSVTDVISSVSGGGSVYTVSLGNVSGNGTIRLDLNSTGTGIKDTAGNALSGGYTSGESYTVDQTPPTVSSVVTTGSSLNKGGSESFDVTFSEAVSGVTVSAFTAATSGTTDSGISVTAMDSSHYTVTVAGVGGNGTLGLNVNSSGTGITDLVGNALSGGFTGGSTYTIDTTPPVVTSITTVGANPNNAASDAFTVTFSEAVTGVGAGDFTLMSTGSVGNLGIASVNETSGTTYVVTVNGVAGDGTLQLGLKANAVGITDAAGNGATAAFTTGQTYTIEHTPPAVTSVAVPTDGTYVPGDKLDFNVTFSEPVTVTGTPRIAINLNTGGPIYANYLVGSGTDTLRFEATVQPGDQALTGITTGTSIDLNGGTIQDAATNAATGASLNLTNEPSTANVDVDAIVPVVSSVTVPANGTYIAGQALDFTVNFSKAVTVDQTGGTPSIDLTLDTGGTVEAAYLSGNGTSALTFEYLVVPNELDTNGVTLGSSIDTNGGTIEDTAGNMAAATLNDVASTAGVHVDSTPPTVISIDTVGSSPNNASSDSFTVTFSEGVTGVATGDFTATEISGTVSGTVSSVTAVSASVYTVTVSSVSGDGTLRLDLNSSGTGIADLATNPIATGYTNGETYTVDHTPPTQPGTPSLTPASDTGSSSSDGITSDTTPVVTGTAEAGSTITLYDTDGTTVLGTGTAAGGGTYGITTSTLSQGAHTLTVTATNAVGNISVASPGLAVTIDTTPPAQPGTPSLTAATDTGSSSSDGITSDTTPVVTGTAEAGSSVTLYDTDGTTVLGTGTATGGTYDITPTAPLGQGSHTLTVTAKDAAGNTSVASSGLAVTIDTIPPAQPGTPSLTPASDTGSSSSDGITSDTTPVVTGTAEVGSTVTLYDTNGTTVLGTGTATGGTYDITPTSPLSQGAHTLTVTATDAAGNISVASSGLAVTIDTVPPVQPGVPSLTAATDTGSSSTDGITSDATPVVTGTAEAGSTVTLYDTNGTTALGTGTATGGTYDITTSTLSAGSHTLTVTAKDAAGNTSVASSGLAVTIDTSPPAQPGTPSLTPASDTGSSSTDGITGDATPVVTGTAEAGSTVTLYDTNGTTVLGTGTATGGTYDITPTSPLGQGAHTLTVTATDAAGNTSVASSGLAVTIDTIAPAQPGTPSLTPASDTGSSSTDGITSDTTPVVTGTAEAGSTVTLYDTNSTTVLGTGTATGGTYDITPTAPLSQGAHTLTATATDAAGNTSVASFGLAVTIDTTAPLAPTLALTDDTGSSATDGLTKDPSITYTRSASGDALLYAVDGGAYSTTVPVFATDGSADGQHIVTAEEEDTAGNVSAPSAGLTFTLDTIAPSIAITAPAANSSLSIIDPTISGTVDTADAGTLLSLNTGQGAVVTTTVAANGTWSVHPTYAADGTYAITASDSDAAGNLGQASESFTINSTPNDNLFGAVTHDVTSAGGNIYALYETILGRAPDALGLEYWVTALGGGTPLTTVAQNFLSSPEYSGDYGSSVASDSAFVNQLFEDGLHRAADPGGLAYWDQQLTGGASRAQVAVDIATSAEGQADLAPTFQSGVFVPSTSDSAIARLYYALLDRAPDAGGLGYWEGLAAQGTSLSTIASGFLGTSESMSATQSNAQFVASLYEGALGHAPDAGSGSYYTGQLNQGTSRASVAISIAEGPEAVSHLAPAIEIGFHIV